MGFEPTLAIKTRTVFKTVSINRSDTPPQRKEMIAQAVPVVTAGGKHDRPAVHPGVPLNVGPFGSLSGFLCDHEGLKGLIGLPEGLQGALGILNPQTAGLLRRRSDSRLWFARGRAAATAFLPRQLGQVMNPLVSLLHL